MDLQPGITVHLLNGTRYAGRWELATVEPVEDPKFAGWVRITGTRDGLAGVQWHTRPEDAFPTEAEARYEGRARRRPRRPKPQPVMGEWGMAVQLGMVGRRK